MWVRFIAASSLMLVLVHVGRADDTPAAQYQRLLDEYEDGAEAAELAARFFDLAKQHPSDPIAVDSLVWVLTKLRTRPEATRALEMLAKDHVQRKELAAVCSRIARTPSLAAEPLLRTLLEKSPHEEVRVQACVYLAVLLDQQASVVDQLQQEPELADRVLQYFGAEYGKHLKSLERDAQSKKREQVYERILKSFADVQTPDGTLGEIAEKALFQIRHLSIGRVAPEIAGEDIFGKTFKLSEYRGKVVVLSFWGHW
jgi:hypothetical protein